VGVAQFFCGIFFLNGVSFFLTAQMLMFKKKMTSWPSKKSDFFSTFNDRKVD
jgi:hypothetical protein